MTTSLTWYLHSPINTKRIHLSDQKSLVFWMTGLSGFDKFTLVDALEPRLYNMGLLDGDYVRCGLSKDFGFSGVDCVESICRIGEVAKLLALNESLENLIGISKP